MKRLDIPENAFKTLQSKNDRNSQRVLRLIQFIENGERKGKAMESYYSELSRRLRSKAAKKAGVVIEVPPVKIGMRTF